MVHDSNRPEFTKTSSPRQSNSMSSRGKGFSLIELLVVVSIIVVLISMLLPAMSMARKEAQSAICQVNLAKMGESATQFELENRKYPAHHLTNANVVIWPSLMRGTTGSSEMFNCPTADAVFYWDPVINNGQPAQFGYRQGESRITSGTGFTYGYNDWGVKEFATPHLGMGGWYDHPSFGGIGRGRVRDPSSMIVFADSTSDWFWDTAIDPQDQNFAGEHPGRRHSGGANVSFIDNHVEFDTQENLISTDPNLRRRWNNDNLPHLELSN